ncbi:hypothetical protein DM02DRAFT_658374 [Periconia macrospinosa]|uniref:Uncharacterized protein n=1 Tax=Periconia macrospinosa TaxID=97972 RepID=A0A2V1DGS0_9PLEO|nr:hypothetical protein DM02DRAFT_658374 [Periconia macrospinosa]
MPRPNRYQPYSQKKSPRFATTAKVPSLPFALPTPDPPSPPQQFQQQDSTAVAQPYQYIAPGNIRGRMPDGKALVTKSAFLAPDGTVHVQMEVVSFPSQDARLQQQQFNSASSSPYLYTPMPSPPMMPYMDPTLSGFGILPSPVGSGLLQQQKQRKRSATGSVMSHDGRSVRSVSEECTAFAEDDEDAEGEVIDPAEFHRLAALQQQKIIADLKAKGVVGDMPFA